MSVTIDVLIDERIANAVATIAKGPPGDTGDTGPAGGAFPPPSAGFPAYVAARDALAARLMALPRPYGWRDVGPQFNNTGGAGSHSYSDVTRMAGGELFYSTFDRSTPYIRRADGSFVAVTSAAIDGVVASGISGGVLLQRSGRVLQIPYCFDKLLAFNRRTNLQEVLRTGLAGPHKWNLGGADPAGVVWGTPHLAKTIFAYDETAPAGSEWWQSPPISGLADYACAGKPTHFPDGWTFFPPYNETRALLINRFTREIRLGATGVFPGGEAFVSSRLISETKALLYPHKHGRPAIYDKASDSLQSFPQIPGVPLGTGNADVDLSWFNGGVYVPDGQDVLIPYKSSTAFSVDVRNMTATALPGAYGPLGALKNGCATDDGNVASAPFNAYSPEFILTGYGTRLDPEFLNSPFHR